MRSSAQMISYEVSIGLIILPTIIITQSFNFFDIVTHQNIILNFFILFPNVCCFFISMLAETNRTPFDLPEAEAELVAGYNVEYSSFAFAMFFLAEYSNMLIMACIFIILYFGGWSFFGITNIIISTLVFTIKILAVCYLYILIRALVPRYKYNQLINIGWKDILPVSFSYICFFFIFTFFCFGT